MTDDSLQSLLAYWQKRLRLQDWDIKVCSVSRFEIDDDHGKVDAHGAKRYAVIKIARDESRDDEVYGTAEVSLVHEMIHLYLTALEPDQSVKSVRLAEEIAASTLAEALVALRYEGTGYTAKSYSRLSYSLYNGTTLTGEETPVAPSS